jgi:N-acetylmuramoyl-L-alanine amidase
MLTGEKIKIILDPGHGGKAFGAKFKGIREKDITMLVAYATKALLESNNFDVVLTRDFDYYVSLSSRADIAMENKGDAFLSLHTNADPDEDNDGDPEAKGEEIWVPEYSIGSDKLANVLVPCIDAIIPNHKHRGVKRTDNFFVLRQLKYQMPCALIEMGFLDNTKEIGVLSSPAAPFLIARLLTKGMVDYRNEEEGALD